MTEMMRSTVFVSVLLAGVVGALAVLYVGMRMAAGRVEARERGAVAARSAEQAAPPTSRQDSTD